MNKLLAVSVAALAAVGLVACSESPTESYVPQFELVDTGKRLDANQVNAWAFGSFLIEVGGGESTARILGADGSEEPANFPGIGVFYGGHCIYGKWYNPKGKATSGSMAKPHPHCVEVTEGGSTIQVILEPISSKYQSPGQSGNEHLLLGSDEECEEDGLLVKFIRAGNESNGYPNSETKGCGEIVAHAIDASTIWNSEPTRIGTLTIDLTDFDEGKGVASAVNLFDTDCGNVVSLNGLTVAGCLSRQITAEYTAPDNTTQYVNGILYWEMSERTTNAVFRLN